MSTFMTEPNTGAPSHTPPSERPVLAAADAPSGQLRLVDQIRAAGVAIGPSILRISPELDRAARVSGASWLRTMTSILFPLLRPALVSGFVLLFISFLKEYSSAIFLFARGSEVIGTTMIELWRQGNSGPVAALATIQLVITFVVLVASQRLFGARLHG